MKAFYHLLGNNTIASIVNYTVWFAIIYYVILKTQSVFAAGIISGLFLVLMAVTSIWFGSLVDHHKKKQVMLFSSSISFICYALAFTVFLHFGGDAIAQVGNPMLWVFILALMVGVTAGNIRNIALPVTVSFMVPEDKRDKVNGLVGTAGGIAFMLTSAISGFLVGRSGMYEVMLFALITTIAVFLHLYLTPISEKSIAHIDAADKKDHQPTHNKVDIRGTIKVIAAVPGLTALIVFNCINNLLGGVFMALMDAYGLALVSVEVWGIIWTVLGTAFIAGGAVIAKIGLGKNPVKTMLLANMGLWVVASVFTIPQSIWPMVGGMYIYMCVMPFIEASEQTVLQKVVPKERQGRVFGFAQAIEQSASPLTAFLIGPLTQFFFIPFMTIGFGAEIIGGWFGVGYARGIALVFTLTGILGLVFTTFALRSKYYYQLSQKYQEK